MGGITEDMIRRRAEHNEGLLHTLEELVLQDQGIDHIDKTLGNLCPNLKILYMPNNLIPRIENMHRLKQLQYLNLALNNIKQLEGLDHCEALEKLDLTLNFVDKDELHSISILQKNIHLHELYLTGNPCEDFEGFRLFVISTLPYLKRLDGVEIKPSERIIAKQEFSMIKEILEHKGCINSFGFGSTIKEHEVNDKGQVIREYTPATRITEYEEGLKLKEDKNKEKKEKPRQTSRRKGFDPLPIEGRIYQKNEGGWKFKLEESECGGSILLDVPAGQYLDTSLIDIDVQPLWVRVLIKGKLLQLQLPEEVKTEESSAQRSIITGHLLITMPKAKGNIHAAKYNHDSKGGSVFISKKSISKTQAFSTSTPQIVTTQGKENSKQLSYGNDHIIHGNKLEKQRQMGIDELQTQDQSLEVEVDGIPPLESIPFARYL